MEEFHYEVKIPKDRVAVLIGKDGKTKDDLEAATGIVIDVNSQEGDVRLSGDDALALFNTREIIKAIGRGFNPDISQMLLKVDFMLDVINIMDYARSKNDMIRLRGRVIGLEGKSRKVIEDLTECSLSVYGKTVSMIGRADHIAIARKAVESLLSGSPHKNVYRFLEKQKRALRRNEMKEEDFVKDEYKKDLL